MMIHCQGIGKPGPGVLLRTRLYSSSTPGFKLVRPVPCTVTISADAVPQGDNGILSTTYETPQQLLMSWKSRKAMRDRLLRDVSNCNQAALAHALDALHSELRQFSALARHLATYHELQEWRSVADEVTDGAEKYLRFLLADGKVYSRLDLALDRILKEDSTTSMGTMDHDGSVQLIRALKNSIALQGNLHDMPNPVQLYCLEAEQPDQPLMRALQDQEQRLVSIIQQLATRGVPWSVPDAAYLHRLQQLSPARAATQAAPQATQPESISSVQTPEGSRSTAEPPPPQADAAVGSSDGSSGPIAVTMAPALAYRMLTSAEPDLRADGYHQGLMPRKDAMKSAQQRLAAVREQIAALNRQDSYAQLMMQSSLAASPAAVITFLQELAAAILPAADQELQGVQQMQQVLCAGQPMQPWDMEYLQAQARQSQGLDITSTELEPYTQLPAVMQGLSSLLQQMFGISLEPRACSDIELLSPASVGYDVLLNGTPAAVMYLHPGTGYGTRVLQFPATTQASSSSSKLIMSIGIGSSDISTLAASTLWELVHELGHAVHLLLSSPGPLMHVSGLYWPKDLVELPSQLMEMLLTHPPSVAQICRHSSTGQQMPGELAAKLAGHFSSRHHSALGMQDKVLTALVDVLYASYGDASDFWEDVYGEMCSVPGLGATFKQLAMIPTAAHHQGLYYMYLYAWVWAVYIWQRVCPDGVGLAVDVEAMGVVMRELLVPGNSRSPLLSLEMCLAGLGLEPGEAVQVQEGCVMPVVDGSRLRQALWVGQDDKL